MKKGIFIVTLLAILASTPAWAGWYMSFGYRTNPLYYYRHGGLTFVSYPSIPRYRGYPLYPSARYGVAGSSLGPVEQIMAIGETKRLQWLASQEEQPAPAVEPEYTPPVIEETPLEAPELKSDKNEI